MVPFVDDLGIRRGLSKLTQDMIPVAVGGDGTLASVVRILRQVGRAEMPLGLLPMGTGNGVAHSLGMARPGCAIKALTHGAPRGIDLMTTTHPQAPVSLLSISAGGESLAMQDFSNWRQRSRLLGALVGGARGLRRVSGLTVEADGERFVSPQDRICNVGIYNAPCYGFGVTPHPRADITDGLADLRVHRSRIRYAAYLGSAALRTVSPIDPTPDWSKLRRVTISSPWPVQVDGEAVAAATFDVHVVPGAVRILVPGVCTKAS